MISKKYCTVHAVPVSDRGGIKLRIVIVLLTLVVVGGAIFGLLRQLGRDQQIDHRKALAISEYGLMVALQRLQSGSAIPETIPKTEYGGGWYRVFFKQSVRNDTVFLVIRAEGHAGSAIERREWILRQSRNDTDAVWTRESIQ